MLCMDYSRCVDRNVVWQLTHNKCRETIVPVIGGLQIVIIEYNDI